jgi:hypothetical protein
VIAPQRPDEGLDLARARSRLGPRQIREETPETGAFSHRGHRRIAAQGLGERGIDRGVDLLRRRAPPRRGPFDHGPSLPALRDAPGRG